MSKEPAKIKRVNATVFNETFIGGDDISLYFKFPEEWEVEFKMRNFGPTHNQVWVQMSYEQAMTFALQILDAARDSKRIYDEYDAYQKAEEEQLKAAILAQ